MDADDVDVADTAVDDNEEEEDRDVEAKEKEEELGKSEPHIACLIKLPMCCS